MRLIQLATSLANAFTEERKAGSVLKAELATVRKYVAELEAQVGELKGELQAKHDEALQALEIMEKGISFTPVADAIAATAKEDSTVDLSGTDVDVAPEVTDNAEVTGPGVSAEVVTAIVESVAAEESIEVDGNELEAAIDSAAPELTPDEAIAEAAAVVAEAA